MAMAVAGGHMATSPDTEPLYSLLVRMLPIDQHNLKVLIEEMDNEVRFVVLAVIECADFNRPCA